MESQKVPKSFLDTTTINNVLNSRRAKSKHNQNVIGIGIELEMERTNAMSVEHWMDNIREKRNNGSDVIWEIKGDGSLRHSGYEVVSRILYGDDEIYRALRGLQSNIDFYGVNPQYTHRCSVHVHMDVRDLTFRQLVSTALVYTTIEPLIFNYCGKMREESFYCLPYQQSDDFVNLVSGILSASNQGQFMERMLGFSKYSALNLAPVFSQGSIEFRMHEGTHDVDTLMFWVNLLKSIQTNGSGIIYDDLPEFISGVGIDDYLKRVLSPNQLRNLYYHGCENDVLNATRIVQNMLRIDKTKNVFKARMGDMARRFDRRGWEPNSILSTYAKAKGVKLTNNARVGYIIEEHIHTKPKMRLEEEESPVSPPIFNSDRLNILRETLQEITETRNNE